MGFKITIIGGGSSTFTPQLMRLFIESRLLKDSTICLMDIDEHRLNVMLQLSQRLIEKTNAPLKVEATTNRVDSLTDADFVITAIAVGGLKAWEYDIEIPAKYGVYMAICDSVGPGGIMRAFRHIPVLVEMVKELEEVSPKAWVFNYTNPVSANCMAMVKNSKIKVIGLCTCSSIPSNPNYLAEIVGVDPGDILTPAPAAGINHCAAILDLKLKDGRDAFQLVKKRSLNPVKKLFLDTYGILPYCWSHWTEFFPFLCNLEEEYKGRLQGLKMKFGLSVHDMVEEQKRAAKWEKLVEDMAIGVRDLSLDVLPSGEAVLVVDIIESLIENKNEVYVVNTLNKEAIENLPFDAIVEVSSVVGGYGIIPMHVGKLPPPLAAVLSNHIEVQKLTVEAALTGDKSLAFQALLQDPQVAAKLKPDEVGRLLDDLLNAHAQYLPRFFRK
ncbi:hypothetical protein KEJ27_03035 [Candidatus Bathyarchaeota archaeon]|nr:hypothetical protein [Candidatus Bathyarchaeota archaeon]MBS7613717.1 hypothetical protein [Candidatus Bathyarchaeota archaeon]MBS7617741.1 hypothetical protein [Candidatus Bathyarchaeota archaeon]